jgi:hypothetical protein
LRFAPTSSGNPPLCGCRSSAYPRESPCVKHASCAPTTSARSALPGVIHRMHRPWRENSRTPPGVPVVRTNGIDHRPLIGRTALRRVYQTAYRESGKKSTVRYNRHHSRHDSSLGMFRSNHERSIVGAMSRGINPRLGRAFGRRSSATKVCDVSKSLAP